jgi:hypothetical protein
LQQDVQALAQGSTARGETRAQFYTRLLSLVEPQIGAVDRPASEHFIARPPIPYLSEPWYC